VLNPRDNDQVSDWYSYRALGNLTYMADGTIWISSNNYGFFGFLLGPSMRSLLSDMAVSLGPDRFRQFWTSPLPPDEAFRAAAGQDIGDWIGSWMRSAYPGSFGRGARIPAMTVVFALGLVILALGSASVAWRRRQVA
jgi:hypothetical protein